MKLWIGKALKNILLILGAVIFFQFPVFMQQYQQQLIGHVHELKWQVDVLGKTAAKSGKSVDEYIKKFVDHPDTDFSNQGEVMQKVQTRWNKLSMALSRLQQASIFTRPFVFLYCIQGDIFKSTAESFELGVIFTMEGLLYALVGMMVAYGLYSFASAGLKRSWTA